MTLEERAKRTCDRLSELEGREITFVQQLTTRRVEITDVYARFVDLSAAVEYLEHWLKIAELYYGERRNIRKPGWDKPKRKA